MQTALADLAGTGTEDTLLFFAPCGTFSSSSVPSSIRECWPAAIAPGQSRCPGCPGRLTFTDYDAIPRFEMPDGPPSSRIAGTFATALWLLLLSLSLTGLALNNPNWRV